MKRIGSVAAVTLAASALLMPVGHSAVGETCRGRAATIVGEAADITGTEGPDVIVAGRGSSVQALGGDDVICMVGSGQGAYAGPGDDIVDTTAATSFTIVTLGLGADKFFGGPGDDQVYGAEYDGQSGGVVNPPDTEVDVFTTGAGIDLVISGEAATRNRDRIVTGRGSDRVDIRGFDAGLVGLDVGPGRNLVGFGLLSSTPSPWTVDTQERTISNDDSTLHWHGDIARYLFFFNGPPTQLEFLGSRADEDLSVYGNNLTTTLRMRGGDDEVTIASRTAAGSIYSLGPDRDSLTVGVYDFDIASFPEPRIMVNLDEHRLDYAVDGGSPAAVINGVESLAVSAGTVRVLGADRGEKIYANGCKVTVLGGAGPDRLTRGAYGLPHCPDILSRLAGGTGADRLVGSERSDDFLSGGRGRDVADGHDGTDTCRAEITRNCERS